MGVRSHSGLSWGHLPLSSSIPKSCPFYTNKSLSHPPLPHSLHSHPHSSDPHHFLTKLLQELSAQPPTSSSFFSTVFPREACQGQTYHDLKPFKGSLVLISLYLNIGSIDTAFRSCRKPYFQPISITPPPRTDPRNAPVLRQNRVIALVSSFAWDSLDFYIKFQLFFKIQFRYEHLWDLFPKTPQGELIVLSTLHPVSVPLPGCVARLACVLSLFPSLLISCSLCLSKEHNI